MTVRPLFEHASDACNPASPIRIPRLLLALTGYPGWWRPGSAGIHIGEMRFPKTVGDGEITDTITGKDGSWSTDTNLDALMDKSGDFVIVASHYRFEVSWQELAANPKPADFDKYIRGTYFELSPPRGATTRYAGRGHILPLLDVPAFAQATAADAGSFRVPDQGTEWCEIQNGLPLLIDVLEDDLVVQHGKGVTTTVADYTSTLVLRGVAINKDVIDLKSPDPIMSALTARGLRDYGFDTMQLLAEQYKQLANKR